MSGHVVVFIGDHREVYEHADGVDFIDDAVYVFKDQARNLFHAVYAPGCWSKVEFDHAD